MLLYSIIEESTLLYSITEGSIQLFSITGESILLYSITEGAIQLLKGVFAKNERGYRLNAIKKRFSSPLILLLSVASI